MTATEIASKRRPLDAYMTPDDLAEALVGLLPIGPHHAVLEPHAGGGAFVRALTVRARHVLAVDIDPDAAVPLHHVGDFLAYEPNLALDYVVGNPPFRGFELHVEHALTLAPNVAFLLRLAVMESRGRVDLWRRWPLRKVWVLAERPSFTGGGTDSAAYGWFWFQRGYRGTAEVVPGWLWRGGA